MNNKNHRNEKPQVCHAVTRGQDTSCSRCGTTWSMDDEKPDCLTHGEHGDRVLKELRNFINA